MVSNTKLKSVKPRKANSRSSYSAPKSLDEIIAEDGSFQTPLPSLFLRAFVWIEECLQSNLANQGLPELSRMESQVLTMIGGGVSRPIEVARALGVSRQTLNQTIRLLQNRNLLEISSDPDDKRCKILAFSEDGVTMMEAAVNIIGHAEDELCRRIGTAKIRKMKETLDNDFGDIPIFNFTE